MTENSEILLSVQDLEVYFHGEDEIARAVDGMDFEVRPHENVCLVGESGCGKTVSALAIMGLIPCPPAEVSAGRIALGGKDLLGMRETALERIRGRRIGMVFQEPLTSLNPVLTIGEQIAEPLRVHTSMPAADIAQFSAQMLQDVGIDRPRERLRDYPHQLSGGMRQRAMIAMALACDPELIIADEPTTALDVTIQAQILELLSAQAGYRARRCIISPTTWGSSPRRPSGWWSCMPEAVVETGVPPDLLKPPHPYTQGAAGAFPAADGPARPSRRERLPEISGVVRLTSRRAARFIPAARGRRRLPPPAAGNHGVGPGHAAAARCWRRE